MTQHQVEFTYKIPEFGIMEIDLDPTLDKAELEQIAIQEINEVYPDVEDIEITAMKEI